jgi:hypothetical protein
LRLSPFFFAANVEVHLGLTESHAGLADVLRAHVLKEIHHRQIQA